MVGARIFIYNEFSYTNFQLHRMYMGCYVISIYARNIPKNVEIIQIFDLAA